MILRLALVILGVSIANSAHACMSIDLGLFREDLRALRTVSEAMAAEKDIKSQIDISVWGVFLDQPSKGIRENGYSRFKVGGVSKGNPSEIISVISTRRNVKLGTEIHKLNLRKIDKFRWTDVGVPQQDLNWGAEACEIAEDSSQCKLYQLEESQNKELCHLFIREVYYGCLSSTALPKMCWQYEDCAFEDFIPR